MAEFAKHEPGSPKVNFHMALPVMASGLYRQPARRMRGYAEAHARQIFGDLVSIPAAVAIVEREIVASFQRRAHLPILMPSGPFEQRVFLPWCDGKPLRLSTHSS